MAAHGFIVAVSCFLKYPGRELPDMRLPWIPDLDPVYTIYRLGPSQKSNLNRDETVTKGRYTRLRHACIYGCFNLRCWTDRLADTV